VEWKGKGGDEALGEYLHAGAGEWHVEVGGQEEVEEASLAPAEPQSDDESAAMTPLPGDVDVAAAAAARRELRRWGEGDDGAEGVGMALHTRRPQPVAFLCIKVGIKVKITG